MSSKYIVVDLFCGAGGFSRGFQEAGFEVRLGIDNDIHCVRTFSFNFRKAVVLCEDVRKITGRDIIRYIGRKPDVVIGGSPCEPFTGVNPRRMKDPLDRLYVDELGQLTLHFIRLVGELEPKVFILENVPGIAREPIRSAIEEEFKRVGYSKVYFNELRAEHYGTPSCRRRVFVSNIELKPRRVKKLKTVREALAGLPPPGSPDVPNHEPPTVNPRKEKKIAQLRWGEALYKFVGADGNLHVNYLKLHPDKPAPTVMGSSRFVHPFENRILTVREQARLQGFPDDHVFFGPRDAQYNQVGEAVPVPLAKAIAGYVLRYLEENGL